MTVICNKIRLDTKGNTEIIDITSEIQDTLAKTKLKKGIVTVFVPGSTAGLTTLEFEPGLIKDLKAFFEKIAPTSAEYQHNIKWHDGNGHSHVRASLVGPSITVPFMEGSLQLGTWQQIIFIDFDNRPRQREIIVQMMGE